MKEITKLTDIEGKIIKIRKRPIVVKAVELKEKVRIHTREGRLVGEKGEYIIEGIQGEVYPIGRKIFQQTYEVVKEGEKEEVILIKLVKTNKRIEMKHSKSANQYEVYGFLKMYLKVLEEDMSKEFEIDEDFELY